MAQPQVGEIIDGYRFNGGDPNSQDSWSQGPKAGDVIDGYVFKGGDPNSEASWSNKRSALDVVSDAGAQLAKGVNTAIGAIPNLINPDSDASKFFKGNADYWEGKQSAQTSALLKEAERRIDEAAKTGMWDEFTTAAKEYSGNPALFQKFVLENLPSMIPGLGVAKGAQVVGKASAVAKGLTAAEVAGAGVKAGVVGGAATNAVMNAGGARQDSFEDWKKTLMAQGMDEASAIEEAKSRSLLAAGVGGVAGAISGGTGLERSILGGLTTKGGLKGFASGAAKELAGEQLEELSPQLATNLQVAEVDPTRSPTYQLGRTAAQTLVASGPGAVLSGAASIPKPELTDITAAPTTEQAVTAAQAYVDAPISSDLTSAVTDYAQNVASQQAPVGSFDQHIGNEMYASGGLGQAVQIGDDATLQNYLNTTSTEQVARDLTHADEATFTRTMSALSPKMQDAILGEIERNVAQIPDAQLAQSPGYAAQMELSRRQEQQTAAAYSQNEQQQTAEQKQKAYEESQIVEQARDQNANMETTISTINEAPAAPTAMGAALEGAKTGLSKQERQRAEAARIRQQMQQTRDNTRAVQQQTLDNENGQFSQGREASPAPTLAKPDNTQNAKDLAQMMGNAERRDNPQATNPQIADVTIHAMSGKTSIPKGVAQLVHKMGTMLGRKVVFFEGGSADGAVNQMRDDKRVFININSSSNINPLNILGHEMMHRLRTESPKVYETLKKTLRDGGIITDEMLADFDQDYNGVSYKDMTEEERAAKREEVLADLKANKSQADFLLEEMLSDLNGNRFTEPDFWSGVFAKIEEREGREAAKPIIARLREALVLALTRMMNALKTLGGDKNFNADAQVAEHLGDVKAALETAFADYMQGIKEGSTEQTGGEAGAKFSKPGSDNGHKRTKAGEYVGAPVGMTSAKLGALRSRLKALAIEGEPGRFWYEDSSHVILAAAEGEPKMAEKLAGLLAIYSPNATVSGNTTMGLKALYQWANGDEIKIRFPVQNEKAEAWMNGTMAEEDALQIKTGAFFKNLMRKIDEDRYGFDKQGATIDMWMARVFGYNSKTIGSDARYYFAEREVKKLADDLGWEPQQVQAALWVSIKSRIESIADVAREWGKKHNLLKRVEKKSGGKINISWEPIDAAAKQKYEAHILKLAMATEADPSGLMKSSYHFGTALKERVGQISWEAIPGKTTGVLPGIFNAPLEQQVEYLAAMDKALRDENGQDLIAKKLHIPIINTAMGPSAWQMAVGAGAQSEVVIPAAKGESVSESAKSLLNTYAAIRGYVLNQEAVVWHLPVFDSSKEKANGIQLEFGRDPTHEEVKSLYQAIFEVSGREDWAPAYVPGVGVRVMNYSDVPNPEFHKLIRKAVEKTDINLEGNATFKADGDYISNDWEANPDGAQYKEIIDGFDRKIAARSGGRSDLQGWVESELRPRAERVNKEFSEKYGWAKLSTGRVDGRSLPAGEDRFSNSRVGQGGRVDIVGVHFSKEQRQQLTGVFFGSGTKSEEAVRIFESKDSRIKSRLYAYVDEGKGVRPEQGVGDHAHRVQFDNLYDLKADALGIRGKIRDANERESAILDAGFNGYYAPGVFGDQGVAILMGGAATRGVAPTAYLGTGYRGGDAVAPKDEPKQTNAAADRVESARNLPSGKMSGSDWKRMVPEATMLEDGKDYYKSDVVAAMRAGDAKYSPARIAGMTEERFNRVFNEYVYNDGRVKAGIAFMSPQEFLDATTSVEEQARLRKEIGQYGKPDLYQEVSINLLTDKDGRIIGHEGRHRMVALADKGSVARVPVVIRRHSASNDPLPTTLLPQKNDGNNGISSATVVAMPITYDNKQALWSKFSGGTDLKFSPSRQTDTPEFKKWFGESKVVDADGKPLVVYHGTNADITAFDPSLTYVTSGVFFAASPESASRYASSHPDGRNRDGANVMPVYLSLQNPRIIDTSKGDYYNLDAIEMAITDGKHDGVIVKDDDGKISVIIAKEPTQIKSATGNNGQFDGSNPDIRYSPGRFYSQLERAVEQAPAKVFGPAQQVKMWIASNKSKLGIKDDEIQWTGVNEWLDLQGKQKVSKDDALGYLKANGVKVEEVMLGKDGDSKVMSALEKKYSEDDLAAATNGEQGPLSDADFRAWQDAVSAMNRAPSKYSQYVLPGGSNYRELLLTLPEKRKKAAESFNDFFYRMEAKYGKEGGLLYTRISPEDRITWDELKSTKATAIQERKPTYRSSHWQEDNILAHVRFNDRVDAEGNTVLFIEEAQSDWSADGSRKGFAFKYKPNEVTPTEGSDSARFWYFKVPGNELQIPKSKYATQESAREYILDEKRTTTGGVEPAPFVTSDAWMPLAMKRVLSYAVEKGYDKVAWINGQQSFERFPEGHDGESTENGMKTSYDVKMPSVMNKILGQLGGGKVEKITIPRSDLKYHPVGYKPESTEFVNSGFTITPSMKEKVEQGMPLFSKARGTSVWDGPVKSKIDDVVYALQDKQIDLKRVVQEIKKVVGQIADKIDPYLQEELFHGRASKGVNDFLDTELRPLLQEMKMRGISIDDFQEYLWNRHAEEANKHVAKINPQMPDGGSGIKTADARAYLSNLGAKRSGLEALAKRIDAINKKSQDILVASGLEKQSTINAWNGAYKAYVPLFREDIEGGNRMGTGKGYSVRGPATKRRTGSNKDVVDILGNIAQQRERNIVRAEKNRVSNALLGLASAYKNPDFWTVDDAPTERAVVERGGKEEVVTRIVPNFRQQDNVVMTRINGEDHFVILNEGDERAMRMAAAIKNMDADQLGKVLGNAAKITRYFASINTQFNPIFGVINLVRDVQGALLNLSTTPIASQKAKVLGYTGDAIRGIYADMRAHRDGKVPTSAWAQLWEEFQTVGGQTGYRDQYANAESRGEAIADELKSLSKQPLMKWLSLGERSPIFGWLSDYNNTMENAVRLASYRTALESGLSKERAASIAKNLTVNFNRKGQVATQMGALYAFFNASAQGTARLAETMFNMENGKVSLKPAGKKILVGGLLLGSMQALLLAAAGFGDDEPPEFIRERNLILPIGGGKYFSLPMPLGFHVIPNLSRIPTEFVLSGFKDPAKRIGSMVGLFFDTFNPMGSAGWSLQTIAPTIVDPLAALAENKDFTGKNIAKVDRDPLNPTPGHTRAKDTATSWSKMISYGMNMLSGGSEFKQGLVSPTPDQIDYLLGQVTGGVGREASKIEQTLKAPMTGEELPIYKVPLLGRFIGDTEGQAAEGGKFYSAIKRINEHEAELKGLRGQKRFDEAREYLRDNPEAMLVMPANNVERDLQKLRKAKRDAVAADQPERVKLIEQQITSRMKQFNARVIALEEKSAN